jgi:SAM-dependent methyltransferase
MQYTTSGRPDQPVIMENPEELNTAILEYYDEFFPLATGETDFFLRLRDEFRESSPIQPAPICRFLGIRCATGSLENRLATATLDVTGIDPNPAMVEIAKRRMRRGYSGIRFFEMPVIDIGRFLKKGSFNIAACLGNNLSFIVDDTLLRKFLFDAKSLLAPGGCLVIETWNYDGMRTDARVSLPELGSVRVAMKRALVPSEDGQYSYEVSVELGNGKRIELQKGNRVNPLTASRIEALAREAGFTGCSLYGDFGGSPWSPESQSTVLVLR